MVGGAVESVDSDGGASTVHLVDLLQFLRGTFPEVVIDISSLCFVDIVLDHHLLQKTLTNVVFTTTEQLSVDVYCVVVGVEVDGGDGDGHSENSCPRTMLSAANERYLDPY